MSSSLPDHGGVEAITVLVTAIGGAGFGEQILKALRLAGGYRIVGVDRSAACVNFSHVDRAFVVPSADHPEYIDALLDVASACGARALFPGCEPELKVLSRARDRIHAAGLLLPIAPASVIDIGMDKLATAAFLDTHNFRHPRSISVTAADLAAVDWFPVVVKPAIGGGGSVDCYVAQSPDELAAVAALLGERSPRMMVQEYVGRPDEEYTVGVLYDLDGQFLNSIALKRELEGPLSVRMRVPNRTTRSDLGETLVISSGFSHGTIDHFSEVTEQCEQIAAALEPRGAINIQCRLVDGVVQVFEINPRLSGTTSLRAMVGYNEPDVLLRKHLLGEDIAARFPYESGRIHRSLVESFVPAAPPSWTTVRTERR